MTAWQCEKCGRKLANAVLPVRCLCSNSGYSKRSADELKRRVAEAVAAKQRLISWLQFFRHNSDRGLGDTAQRLGLLAKRKSEVHTAIKQLLSQCSCSRVDAVERLNKQHPY